MTTATTKRHWIGGGYETMSAGRYIIAYSREDGDWDMVEFFEADDDAEANEYAERHYSDEDWYVLDWKGQNINA